MPCLFLLLWTSGFVLAEHLRADLFSPFFDCSGNFSSSPGSPGQVHFQWELLKDDESDVSHRTIKQNRGLLPLLLYCGSFMCKFWTPGNRHIYPIMIGLACLHACCLIFLHAPIASWPVIKRILLYFPLIIVLQSVKKHIEYNIACVCFCQWCKMQEIPVFGSILPPFFLVDIYVY